MATEAQLDAVRQRANQEALNAIDQEENLYEEKADDSENPDALAPSQESTDIARDLFYPLNMSKNFPGRIIFKVKKIEGENILDAVGITKVIDKGSEILSSLTGNETKAVADEGTSAEDKKQIFEDSKKKQKELISYENNSGGKDYGKITLPLPKGLAYNDAVSYAGADLGILGGAAEDALLGRNPFAGATTANGELVKAASAIAGQVVAANAGGIAGASLGLLPKVGGGVAGAAGAVLGSGLTGNLGAAVSSATRVASAPNSRTIFEKSNIRSFAFNFKMIANSEEEARMIKKIVQMFREELYPEKVPIGNSGVPLAYKYPNVFEIEVKNRQGSNPGFKIQRCYLEKVDTTFNETADGMFNDGSFIEVSIALGFKEIVALDKTKVRQGY
jgi:hypothetical protein